MVDQSFHQGLDNHMNNQSSLNENKGKKNDHRLKKTKQNGKNSYYKEKSKVKFFKG